MKTILGLFIASFMISGVCNAEPFNEIYSKLQKMHKGAIHIGSKSLLNKKKDAWYQAAMLCSDTPPGEKIEVETMRARMHVIKGVKGFEGVTSDNSVELGVDERELLNDDNDGFEWTVNPNKINIPLGYALKQVEVSLAGKVRVLKLELDYYHTYDGNFNISSHIQKVCYGQLKVWNDEEE